MGLLLDLSLISAQKVKKLNVFQRDSNNNSGPDSGAPLQKVRSLIGDLPHKMSHVRHQTSRGSVST